MAKTGSALAVGLEWKLFFASTPAASPLLSVVLRPGPAGEAEKEELPVVGGARAGSRAVDGGGLYYLVPRPL